MFCFFTDFFSLINGKLAFLNEIALNSGDYFLFSYLRCSFCISLCFLKEKWRVADLVRWQVITKFSCHK